MSKASEDGKMEAQLKAFEIPYEDDFFSGCPIPGNPSHPWYRALSRLFGVGIILLSLAIVAATSIMVLMIKPILNHRGYYETNCTVTQSGFYGKWQNCSCGLNCISEIPCGRVIVSYPTIENSSVVIEDAILHEDQLNARYYPLCSISTTAACFHPKYREHNLKDVQEFIHDTGEPGNVFRCLYCSWDVRRVVLRILPPQSDIVTLLGVSWGIVIFFFLFLVAVGVVLSRKQYKHLRQPASQSPRLHHHSEGTNADEDVHSRVTFSNLS